MCAQSKGNSGQRFGFESVRPAEKDEEGQRKGPGEAKDEEYHGDPYPQRETPQRADAAHVETTLDESTYHHNTSHPSMQVLLDYVKRYQDEHREGATEVFYSEDPVLRALQIDIRAVINPADVEWHNENDGELNGPGKRTCF